MRTTLTLDDDVAVQLKRLMQQRDASLKNVINDALRRGFSDMEAQPKQRKPFRMKTFDGGELLFPIDNFAEALAYAEGENFK
jgi:predicted transcriptional regulator